MTERRPLDCGMGRAQCLPVAMLHTATGTHCLRLRIAASFGARFAGLMFAKPLAHDAGVLLSGVASIHTCFVRAAIDVVYVDGEGYVRRCAPSLAPWRISRGGRGVAHTLELADGAIERLHIRPGDRLVHSCTGAPEPGRPAPPAPPAEPRQSGAALTEFVVIGPLLIVLGLAILEYGMLFLAKNQINHAAFMAARAGSTGNADLAAIRHAYAAAMAPLYAHGRDESALAAALARARQEADGFARIAILNPTQESFDDWHDPVRQRALGLSKRVIPNGSLAFKGQAIGPRSGQTIQDANLLKLRITHGYQPKVPVVSSLFKVYMQWLDTKEDAFHTMLVDAGRIPVVSAVTLHMQSDAIEPDMMVSAPAPGNGGKPVDPGAPPVVTTPPPECATISCKPPPAPPCDPLTDPNGCRPPGCKAGDPNCDPACKLMCCTGH